MTLRRAPGSTGGTIRRWHIPPPLVHGPEPLEGGAVLAEVPGPRGLLLWQALRDVLLWAETPADQRTSLFAAGAAGQRRHDLRAAQIEAEDVEPLMTLAELLDDPVGIERERVAAACHTLAARAEAEGKMATALAFAQNAAVADPSTPAPALEVARLAVRMGDHARAEIWYRRAVGIGRRAKEWRPYTRAFAGLGALYRSRGNLPGAQRFHLRALRGAKRGRLREERAVALHDLFGVAVEAGRPRDAEKLARDALAAYPQGSPKIAALAHDVAYHWMEQGLFARALRVFQAVEPVLAGAAERLWLQADLMRAAAGAGKVELARQMSAAAAESIEAPELAAAAPRAWLEIARGELQLGRFAAAESAARRAQGSAGAQHDGRTAIAAEALLDAIRHGRSAAKRAPTLPVGVEAADPRRDGAAPGDDLAEALIRALQGSGAMPGAPAAAGADGEVDTKQKETTRREAQTR